MTTYARIVDGVAVDVVTSDPADLFHPEVAAEFIVVPDTVTAGSTLGANGAWTPPPPPEVVLADVVVSKYGLMQLFSPAQRAIYYQQSIAANALPVDAFSSAASAEQQVLAQFYDYLALYQSLPADPGVNLSDPVTIAAISELFVALGIVTPAEAARVLANQPPPTTAAAA